MDLQQILKQRFSVKITLDNGRIKYCKIAPPFEDQHNHPSVLGIIFYESVSPVGSSDMMVVGLITLPDSFDRIMDQMRLKETILHKGHQYQIWINEDLYDDVEVTEFTPYKIKSTNNKKAKPSINIELI